MPDAQVIPFNQMNERVRRLEATKALLRRGMVIRKSKGRAAIPAIDLTQAQTEYPRWSSGVAILDKDFGGFQGLTAVGAEEGAGKSMLAVACASENAQADICTLYFDAENGPGLTKKRLARYFGAESDDKLASLIGTSLWYIPVGLEHARQDICGAVLERIRHDHEGVLIIVDSVNSVVEMLAEDADDEFRDLRIFVNWANWLVRESSGFIRFLLLSELNKGGGLKGVKIGYLAQVALRITKDDEQGEDVVSMRLHKNRDGRSGEAGLFSRAIETNRFLGRNPKAQDE